MRLSSEIQLFTVDINQPTAITSNIIIINNEKKNEKNTTIVIHDIFSQR